ncbi:hypothetical protein JOB18_021010 [Solea senegalensis]|uniref:Uncharacterized protein n=1 Tax=Solea senegalensis TaxID=28829 RepID=A0AAV6S637_SOLSE|nr:hypothetical protein JOB18_021010 [Solea senegalensis]
MKLTFSGAGFTSLCLSLESNSFRTLSCRNKVLCEHQDRTVSLQEQSDLSQKPCIDEQALAPLRESTESALIGVYCAEAWSKFIRGLVVKNTVSKKELPAILYRTAAVKTRLTSLKHNRGGPERTKRLGDNNTSGKKREVCIKEQTRVFAVKVSVCDMWADNNV